MRSSNTGASILRLLLSSSLLAAAAAAAQREYAPRPKPKTVASKEHVDPRRSLPALRSREEFDRMARVFTDQPYALPHVIFVIDRRDRNKIYYVNSQRFRFHKDFVKGTYLSLENAQDFFRNNYLSDKRRFILGTLAWQAPVKRYTFEHWAGDLITPELIQLTADVIKKTFYDPVAFKPNSLKQEQDSAKIAGLERVTQDDISRGLEYQALNVAKGLGRIHIIDKLDEHVEIGSNEILVLNEVPDNIPSVAGLIISKPSTPLSHINLLVKGWGVPNAYVKDANQILKEYDGWWVSFETTPDKYTIKRADKKELDEYLVRVKARQDVMTPRFNLEERRLLDLSQQRARMSDAFGSKSANLGEVARARIPGISVPAGFGIPIAYYDEFVKENNLEEPVYEMMNDQKFVHDPAYRKERLAEMRARFKAGKVGDKLRGALLKKVRAEYAGKGLFVRSSSNVEDLPNFNGAGLYDTVPNVKEDEKLLEAVKTVWASLWNFEAYEARERASIDHSKAYMAVLVQEGVNADSAGVMITTDPFDADNRGAIYISAKRGLGIKVVEGKRIPEQLLFLPRANQVKVLTRSEEDSLLTFDEAGGVREVPISGERAVLTDAVVRKLARAASQIKGVFKGKEQDIEWVYMRGQVYIVQSRPYVQGG
ncbi:MAG TPA: PEP/pyruvate-binding domain-containing protein [Pyrinomonadaceae bacterium]|nr:PEP/pyruvate-binding domain-containing protein [Pyrinomonadaceae bacterium]